MQAAQEMNHKDLKLVEELSSHFPARPQQQAYPEENVILIEPLKCNLEAALEYWEAKREYWNKIKVNVSNHEIFWKNIKQQYVRGKLVKESDIPDSNLLQGFYKRRGKTSWEHNIQETPNMRFHSRPHGFCNASNTSQSLKWGSTTTWSNLKIKMFDTLHEPSN